MNRISKKLLLILFFICILVAIATWYVIRLSNSVSVINNSEDPVSLPVSFIQDSTSIVPNTELHESKESLDNNNQPPTNSPQVITHEIIKPNTNPFPNTNNGPTNLPYEKSPYCTDESTFFEARIFTGDYIHIQQGSNAGIYAETLHNCTNPEIVKTWIDMTTGATLSNSNQIDTSSLSVGEHVLKYATWNEEFYSDAVMLIIVNENYVAPVEPSPVSFP